jgi:hypothetical protein
MNDLTKDYVYEVVVHYTINPEELENFVENYKFKNDRYVISVQKVEKEIHICKNCSNDEEESVIES